MRAPERRVLLAAPRGFCAGVDRAVATVERALAVHGSPVYVRKEIVHNKHVVEDLKRQGAVFVDELDKIPEGATVVFSAHGVSPAVRAEATARGLRAIDATCPLVTKVHQEVVRFAADGYRILLVGHEGHEEVEGTMGEALDQVTLVDTAQDAANVEIGDQDRVVWLSQTTLSVDETSERVARLSDRFPTLEHPPSSDICYATTNRQLAVKQLALECELVIVVGARNSSNSRLLVEVATRAGAGAAYLVDTVGEVDPNWLTGVHTVGVTSGASVPELLVRQVLRYLAEQGWPEPEEVVTAEERQVFALPRALRN